MLLVVVVNLGIVTYWRGLAVYRERWTAVMATPGGHSVVFGPDYAIPPWKWTPQEWRETWPWK